MLSESIQELPQMNVTDKLNSSTNLNTINSLNTQFSNNQNLESVNKLDTHREIDDNQMTTRVDDNNNQNNQVVANNIIQKEPSQNNLNIQHESKASKTLLSTQSKYNTRVKPKEVFKSSLTVRNKQFFKDNFM